MIEYYFYKPSYPSLTPSIINQSIIHTFSLTLSSGWHVIRAILWSSRLRIYRSFRSSCFHQINKNIESGGCGDIGLNLDHLLRYSHLFMSHFMSIVGRSVGLLVGLLCHNFQNKRREVTLLCSYWTTCL